MTRRRIAALLAATGALALGSLGCGDDEKTTASDAAKPGATAKLTGVNGAGGTVTFTEAEGGIAVRAEVSGLEPGFHGFHIHETATCDPQAVKEGEQAPFSSAGAHYTAGSESHGTHSGDMPPLLAGDDGRATASFTTQRYKLADVQDGDGSAVIVHADPDNAANIPQDRYQASGKPGPDADTLKTGDSGDRVACGLLGPAK